MRIFLAGANGTIGRRLIPLLVAAGHVVTGTTRSAAKVEEIRGLGGEAVVVDAFDAAALRDVVLRARPEVVIHQLTDLPDVFDPARLREVLTSNSRLRIEGTANLVAAAQAAGARRLIAQSLAFAYADGPEPHAETDAIASAEGDTPSAITARGVRALEKAVLNAPGIDGIVLRYGRLYGPGTWNTPNARAPLHVDAAAHATLLAVTRGSPGVYNIAEDDGAVTVDKARRELGFDPAFRLAN
ncbi:MAG: NAD(P)-dependent oxidoreductase [Hyphomicrobiales bacterium]|nr:NAD(P)-dependent oxidoreductase [Hyphomicrobiales bacterium]MDE2374233.1 NAD(P)-dependent oxidoreductase [Hyphomicrobiales bacterium]